MTDYMDPQLLEQGGNYRRETGEEGISQTREKEDGGDI